MKKIIVLTTATALLSSCGIYTKYQPAETTPDNLYGEEVAVDDTTNFGNVNWRELFTDPQLQALIEQGLQNNTMPSNRPKHCMPKARTTSRLCVPS